MTVRVHTVCVTKATINGVTNGSTIDADTAVNCTADVNAYPPASYRWRNNHDSSQSTSTGQQYVLQPGTQYKLTCEASNDFDRCYATDYVEFNSKWILYLLCFPFCGYCYDNTELRHCIF